MKEFFSRFAQNASNFVGSYYTFLIALTLVLGWALSGPIFNYSSTWQLFINTITTIVTFLMVFLIQNAQNRDAKATHLKLDELIRASRSRNKLIQAEEFSEEELTKEKKEILEKHVKVNKKQIDKLKDKLK